MEIVKINKNVYKAKRQIFIAGIIATIFLIIITCVMADIDIIVCNTNALNEGIRLLVQAIIIASPISVIILLLVAGGVYYNSDSPDQSELISPGLIINALVTKKGIAGFVGLVFGISTIFNSFYKAQIVFARGAWSTELDYVYAFTEIAILIIAVILNIAVCFQDTKKMKIIISSLSALMYLFCSIIFVMSGTFLPYEFISALSLMINTAILCSK